MRTDPRGSYAAHIAASQAHNGRTVCHDFRPAGAQREHSSWWLVAVAFVFIAACWIGAHS